MVTYCYLEMEKKDCYLHSWNLKQIVIPLRGVTIIVHTVPTAKTTD